MATISKEKRSGKYRVLIRKRGLPTISKTFTRRKDALTWAQDKEGDREKHIAEGNTVARSMTLLELIDEYLSQWEGRDSSTLSRLAWWRDQYGHKLIGEIDKSTVREGIAKLSAIKKRGGHGKPKIISGKRSPATLNRYAMALSGVFKYAVTELDLPKNPVSGIKAKKESRGRVRFLTDDERRALLTACHKSKWKRLYLIVLLAITTGARRGELIHLKWSDINFKQRTVLVNKTKNDEPKILNLTDESVNELLKFREVGAGSVFPSTRKAKSDFMAFDTFWKKALLDAQIEDFRFHDLRHTAASYLAMNGATLHEIAEVLGHKQLEVTRRYSHLCTEHKANLIDRVMGNIHE